MLKLITKDFYHSQVLRGWQRVRTLKALVKFYIWQMKYITHKEVVSEWLVLNIINKVQE